MKKSIGHGGFTFLLLTMAALQAQSDLQSIGSRQYAKWGGVWYTAQNGEQGNRADIDHLIVRLKNNGNIRDFD